MKKNEGVLGFNPSSKRVCIAYTDHSVDLHCGDCFQIFLDGRWLDTAIEMRWPDREWYLTGFSGRNFLGLRARDRK
ncbi:MAG: DUF5348 domain-containing protein [Lachnospiraceae bacterium]|nr:DUF5348 domain-containing protein [Lachnospiraceae bacterium]